MKAPIYFVPYLKSVIWGGDRIAPFKGIQTNQANIGESWEISAVPDFVSQVACGPYRGKTLTELIDMFGADLVGTENFKRYGNKFPLLIKIIDAAENLSVQVHPDDELAMQRHNSLGKTEMWTVIDAIPDSKIRVGFLGEITPEEYERRVADSSIMDVIAEYPTRAGDVFYIPAGQIHAIGAGNMVVEIQQTSDVTYRIYDYNRRDKEGNTRQLHTDLALQAIDYKKYPPFKYNPSGSLLVDCPYFEVHRIIGGGELPHNRDSFTIVMTISGSAEISYSGGKTIIPRGHTCLFPATMHNLTVAPGATVLSIQA